jgi:xanthine dehydrogenase YagR molybdenum-binding subunit
MAPRQSNIRPREDVIMPTDNRPMNRGCSFNDDASRLDGAAKVTGRAKYGRDQYLDNQLFVAFIRCPFGAAELKSSDADAARKVAGVLEVNVQRESGEYHGHNVGHIVAESKTALRQAMRALNAQWKPLPVKTRIEEALPPAAAMEDDLQKLFADSPLVLEAVYSTPIQTHSSLETHGAVIDYRGDSAVCYVSTQGTSAARDGLGEALGLPSSNFEVVCEYVGGGFGSKLNGAGKEGITAALVAAKYKRPVSLFVERDEDHLDTGNRPSLRAEVKIAFKKNGNFLGGFIRTLGGVGVSRGGGGAGLPSGNYDLGNIRKEHVDVRLNGGAPRPFRAPGRPQGTFVEELMLDEMAVMMDIDPVQLRLRLDSDPDRREMYELAARQIGWSRRQRTGSQTGAIRRGFGIGSCTWGRFPAEAEAEVAVHRDGSVEVRTGTQDIGTGMRTVAGVTASQYLGVPLERVNVRIGSSTLPPGPGSGGSVTSHNTAPAIMNAAANAKKSLLEHVASAAGGTADEYDIVDGSILHHNEPVMTFAEACARIPGESLIGRGANNRPSREKYGGEGHSHGVQAVELEVDCETGIIAVQKVVAYQSCGQVVCRKTAESQIIGGVIQGLSYALFEEQVLDRNTGAMVNPNFEWYRILGTADMPHIVPVLWTKGQTGVRSLGEPPTIPTAGATACALFNAIGAPVRHLPLTPDRVLAAVEAAARGGAA